MKFLISTILLLVASVAHANTYVYVFWTEGNEGAAVARTIEKATTNTMYLQLVKHEEATAKRFKQGLALFSVLLKKEDTCIIYISAHGGMSNGMFNFSCWKEPAAEKWDNIKDSVFANDVQPVVDSFPCPTLLILDCCKCGGILKEPWKKTTVICACSDSQASWTGVMCPVTCEAFAGIAADINKDEKITMGEAVEYIPNRIREISTRQKPCTFVPKDAKMNTVLTKRIQSRTWATWKGEWCPVEVTGDSNMSTKVVWPGGLTEWIESGRVLWFR